MHSLEYDFEHGLASIALDDCSICGKYMIPSNLFNKAMDDINRLDCDGNCYGCVDV